MKKIVTINEKEYKLKNIGFEEICLLEELGFSIITLKDKSLSSIRALFMLVSGLEVKEANTEIEEHIKKKGAKGFDDFKGLVEMVTESDFFRNLSK